MLPMARYVWHSLARGVAGDSSWAKASLVRAPTLALALTLTPPLLDPLALCFQCVMEPRVDAVQGVDIYGQMSTPPRVPNPLSVSAAAAATASYNYSTDATSAYGTGADGSSTSGTSADGTGADGGI